MSTSTVLVYEFFTGGGRCGKNIDAGLAMEALGMLWALLVDFKRWGKVRTLAALDSFFENRVPGLNRSTLPADRVVEIANCDYRDVFDDLLRDCDAAIIIAPETCQILAELTARAESVGIPVLGAASCAAATAGNKEICHAVFEKTGLPFPKTRVVQITSLYEAAETMRYPFVIKPLDGAGCEGVCLVDCSAGLDSALELMKTATAHKKVLLQDYAAGRHFSVSILSNQQKCMPMSLNLQQIQAGMPFRYLGGEVPGPEHPAAALAKELACKAVRSIPGLRGYVGVDLILGENSAQLIEINPRLTTSYLGLRQVSRLNIAQAIYECCLFGTLPEEFPLSGQAAVSKENPGSWGISDMSGRGL